MSNPDLQAMIDAAEAYEGLHVPAIFEEWPPYVLEAADVSTGDRVLDVACGTGVLARFSAARVGPDGEIHGLDPNPGMLAVANEFLPDAHWHDGVASEIPLPDASFDAVVSQFGMMFFPDRTAAIREMLRVLRPGGRLAVAVWDGLENQPAYSMEVDLLERLAGEAAADALRAPFVLGNAAALVAEFTAAGVDAAAATTHTGTARFPSVRVMVEADLRGWLPVMGVHLDEATIERVLEEAELVLSPFVQPSGEVAFASPAHVISGGKA